MLYPLGTGAVADYGFRPNFHNRGLRQKELEKSYVKK